ncbi:hypothetical protein E1B28_009415 [Marasmius oreades]|uniref:Uncharacterized protein n=1 Tax=Marasmius oreades TaxID=181124 RepID=A0A9P7S0K7_9AGAR|nr:uncharacterized protein E1B28_009415 [Marasmius oreades]KAG7093132.1 hypothetical protein E1B28_009415 [Marasmius oreades]
MSIFMFFVSTLYWISKLLGLLMDIEENIIHPSTPISISPFKTPSTPLTISPFTHFEAILSSVVLMNYALTDGVVLWRAWALCSADYRKWLYVPLFFLCCACTTISATIVVRITIQSIPHVDGTTSDPRIKKLTRAIDVFQTSNLGFSLLMNLSATGLIALKAWRFRRWIKFDLKAIRGRRTRGEKIMVLLVESGVLYCISIITTLVFTLIRLPIGTLGDIYTPVNVQIAGIYPLVVLLLVNHGQSLEQTMLGRNTITNAGNPHSFVADNNPGTLESLRFRTVRPSSASLAGTFSRGQV